MNTDTLDFTNPGLFAFDSNDIEIAGGIGKLKSYAPNSSFGCKFYDTVNANYWTGASGVNTPVGGAAISGNKLDLKGGTVKYLSCDPSNINYGSKGTIRFKYTPNYTASTPYGQTFFGWTGPDSKNSANVTHAGDGNIYTGWTDKDGVLLIGDAFGYYSPTTGVTDIISVCWNFDDGFITLFINGTALGTFNATGLMENNISIFNFGSEITGSGTSECEMSDLQIFDTVLYPDTVNPHDPNYTVPDTLYSIVNPTIVPIAPFNSSLIKAFRTTEAITGSDKLKYTLLTGSQDRYVTSGVSENSNGTYAQSSDKATLLEDLGGLITIESDVACKLKIFLHSEGNSTPEISLAEIDYLEILALPDLSTRVQVEGYIELAGNPAVNLPVYVRPFEAGFWNNGGFHEYAWEKVGVCHSTGYMFGYVYLQPTGKFWEMKIGPERYKFTVLDQEQMDISLAPVWEKIVEV